MRCKTLLCVLVLLSPIAVQSAQHPAPADEALRAKHSNTNDVVKSSARLHLYIFQKGLPLAGVKLLEIHPKTRTATDVLVSKSNTDGAIHMRLLPGEHQLDLQFGDRRLAQLNLSLSIDESIEIIVNIPADGSPARVTVETSHKDKNTAIVDNTASPTNDTPKSLGNARIESRITSLQGGNPVPGAQVYISGISQEIRSDEEGRFSLQVPAGIYSLSVVHKDFSTQVFDEFVLNDNDVWDRAIELTPSAVELDEFVVTAPNLDGSFAALADEQRNTSAVVEVLGAEQMSNAGDSDAASALKRVTGLTVVNGKYIYVRGLGERYSSVNLNGAGVASPDPTRRVVPLDLFPTGMLGSVVIQKTYSPNMPGEFGGGTIQLFTRGLPEEKFTKISASLQMNSQSTFQDGLTYDGGAADILGFDDGTRAFPDQLDALTHGGSGLLTGLTPSEVEAAGESLPSIYTASNLVIPADVGIKFIRGDRFESYLGNWGWGYIVSVQYKNEWQKRDEDRASYSLGTGNSLVQQDVSKMQVTENEIDLGGMATLALELGNNDLLESTTMLTRNTTDTVVRENAYFSENDITVQDTTLEWVERQLFMQQFRGEHVIPRMNELKVNWLAAYSVANRDAPDLRFYRYEQDTLGRFYFSKEGQSNETSFESLQDESRSYNVDFTLPIYDFFNSTTALKFGLLREEKNRDSKIARFRFLTDFSRNAINQRELYNSTPEFILTPENIGPKGYQLRNTTQPTDNYTAAQTVNATYVMGESAFTHFKWMAGARVESSNQQVTTFKLTNPNEKVIASLETTDVLPAASMTWLMNRDMQVRLAYGQTVNRPDFKELSAAPYIDSESRYVVIGNPNLERALISHYDLRWEWYLTRFESMSVAVFYKDFDRPIEQVIRLGAGGIRTFANAESAVNVGVEFQGRTWLSRIFGKRFSRFYVDGNLSLIQSEVQLGDAGAQQTNQTRALQGQSPWAVNMTLGYENLISRVKASLMFNMAGERITSVGVKGMPDAYQQPIPLLDAVFSQTFYEGVRGDKWKIKFRVKNILNPLVETLRGDEVERSTKYGTSYKVSMQYKFPT